LAAVLAALGGAGLWAIAAAGRPGWVPARYGPAAALVPFAAGPAALCAGWAVLALWRCGRRAWASVAALATGAALLAGLLAAGAAPQHARLVILLAITVPLLVAHAANVALLGWATRLGRRGRAVLLAVAALPLAAGFLGWPAPLWGIAALLPVVAATPLLAAAFLTGARPDQRPRGGPVLATAFFGLPVALLAGALGAALAGPFGFRVREFFDVEEPGEREAPRVDFGTAAAAPAPQEEPGQQAP
jgi:hypothetical protein